MDGLKDLLPSQLTGKILWGVEPWQIVLATLVIFIGFASRKLVIAVFGRYLMALAKRTRVTWDDDLVRLLPTPLSFAVQIGLWYGAVSLLVLPNEPIEIRKYIFQGLQAALGVAFAWAAFRLVDVFGLFLNRLSDKTESRLDDQLVPLVRKTLKLVVGITFGIMIVQNLGYSVTSLLASLGVGGLALALAARDTVANVFGSVVVFTDRPFQVGDWVEFGGIEGTVEEVGFRTTRVRRFDKSLVTVPNQMFSTTPITNHSERNIRRINMTIGVSYETSQEKLSALLADLRELVQSSTGIDQGFNFVHFTEFADSSLNIQIYCFTESTVWTDFLSTREKLMLQVMELVEKHGLEMAFPTRTVYLRDEHWGPKNAANA